MYRKLPSFLAALALQMSLTSAWQLVMMKEGLERVSEAIHGYEKESTEAYWSAPRCFTWGSLKYPPPELYRLGIVNGFARGRNTQGMALWKSDGKCRVRPDLIIRWHEGIIGPQWIYLDEHPTMELEYPYIAWQEIDFNRSWKDMAIGPSGFIATFDEKHEVWVRHYVIPDDWTPVIEYKTVSTYEAAHQEMKLTWQDELNDIKREKNAEKQEKAAQLAKLVNRPADELLGTRSAFSAGLGNHAGGFANIYNKDISGNHLKKLKIEASQYSDPTQRINPQALSGSPFTGSSSQQTARHANQQNPNLQYNYQSHNRYRLPSQNPVVPTMQNNNALPYKIPYPSSIKQNNLYGQTQTSNTRLDQEPVWPANSHSGTGNFGMPSDRYDLDSYLSFTNENFQSYENRILQPPTQSNSNFGQPRTQPISQLQNQYTSTRPSTSNQFMQNENIQGNEQHRFSNSAESQPYTLEHIIPQRYSQAFPEYQQQGQSGSQSVPQHNNQGWLQDPNIALQDPNIALQEGLHRQAAPLMTDCSVESALQRSEDLRDDDTQLGQDSNEIKGENIDFQKEDDEKKVENDSNIKEKDSDPWPSLPNIADDDWLYFGGDNPKKDEDYIDFDEIFKLNPFKDWQ